MATITKNGKTMGRPKIVISQSEFEKLCEMQCTEEEVLAWFSITDKTLNRWCRQTYGKTFSEVFREKRKKGLVSLRRSQFQLAKKNAALSIFLGKNYLGQRDYKENKVEVTAAQQEKTKLDGILAQLETEDDDSDD